MPVSLFARLNGRVGLVTCSHGGGDLAQAVAFCGQLSQYSLAHYEYVSAAQGRLVEFNAETPGAIVQGPWANINLYAHVWLRDAATGKCFALKVLAPQAFLFGDDQRVTPEYGAALAAIYSRLAGREFTFMHGKANGHA